MPTTANKPQALKAFRRESGLTAQTVADMVAAILGEDSRHGESIANIERRGTRDHYVLKALATVYGRQLEEIAEAAAPRKIQNKNK